MKYPVAFEQTSTGFSAYVPDLPGCVATGSSIASTRELIAGAIALHVAGMRADGTAIPEPSIFEMVDVGV